MLRCCVVGAAAAALSAPFASAQITEEDDLIFGAGSITRDAGQNLDFLDLTLSANRSYDDVSMQFGPGGDFEGWRHASEVEAITLVNNWGFTPFAAAGVQTVGPANLDQVNGLVALLGSGAPPFEWAIGITGTVLPNGRLRRVEVLADGIPSTNQDVISAVGDGQSSDTGGGFGHWLVRDVPGPSALALFGSVALAGVRRRR